MVYLVHQLRFLQVEVAAKAIIGRREDLSFRTPRWKVLVNKLLPRRIE